MGGRGRLVVIGDVMTDIIVLPEGPLVRGSDRRARIVSKPGGSGANQAVWLGAMGADVEFAARVGSADRDRWMAYFRGFGVIPRLAGDETEPSGTLVTIVDPDGERSFLTDRGANLKLAPPDLPSLEAGNVFGVVISGYSFFAEGPRATVSAFAASALAANVEVSLDAASVGFLEEVGPATFRNWTQGFSTLFANAEEAECLSGSADLDTQMRELGRTYHRVIIKRGAAGAAIGGRDGVRLTQPAERVTPIDTTGAGDAFAAGFLAARQLGESEAEALSAGIAAGARAVAMVGGQPPRGLILRAGTLPA
jgi:sugar/nucleoside kinase (ribokinase family)